MDVVIDFGGFAVRPRISIMVASENESESVEFAPSWRQVRLRRYLNSSDSTAAYHITLEYPAGAPPREAPKVAVISQLAQPQFYRWSDGWVQLRAAQTAPLSYAVALASSAQE